ncbi:glycoside hydrolase family 99-like domain-containing protein [Pseudomonas sp. R1-7]|uniref:glycoside hydrolase family 99-like domain-containing protein n=1 Tax=Pseudomonas sp. R1-7 TaxID=2817398 RepID=UPI003DAA2749
MNDLFSNLFVSSPNGGGLFFLDSGVVFRLDGLSTVGLNLASNSFLRAIQPDALWVCDEQTLVLDKTAVDLADIHDVLEYDDHYYVVGTTYNEVIKFKKDGSEVERWRAPGEDDSKHLNCLAIWNNRVVYSAFGEFAEHRGYKGKSAGQGVVKDLETGETLITGLSQPHSLVQYRDNLLVANSEMKEICEYSESGVLIRSKYLKGYTRGICLSGNVIYVGLSRSRNIDSLSVNTATVLALDAETWEELDRVAIPADEIYSVVSINNHKRLISTLVSLFSQTASSLENIAESRLQAQAIAHEAEQLSHVRDVEEQRQQLAKEITNHKASIRQSLDERAELNKKIGELSQERALYQSMVEEIRASTSWRLTSPLRAIAIFIRKVFVVLGKIVLRCYRILPVSQYMKQKLKNVAFTYLGFLFRKSSAYTTWKEFRSIDRRWHSSPAVKKSDLTGKGVTANVELPNADGVWEWEDYLSVKDRIKSTKKALLEKVRVDPLHLLKLPSQDYLTIASNFQFPELSENPKVTIVIPVYNNVKLSLECLSSIEKFIDFDISFEIIVADDASTDETSAVFSRINNIRYVRNEHNLGFLQNCNGALKLVKGEYTLFLNNDVQVTQNWLKVMLATFVEFPKVGVVGPKFVYPTGHLQEAGAALMPDGGAVMVGLNQDANQPKYNYVRRVDYVSGACLLLPTHVVKDIGGFSEEFLPCYCEDSDLCLSVRAKGYDIYYNPGATIIHHLSKTTVDVNEDFKLSCIAKNVGTLQQKWKATLVSGSSPRIISFYLPQFHPVPENDQWWGKGFTEWTNVSKARPNFVGHYQPRLPADIGYYDLRLLEVMEQQAELARKYGVHGFCFYYYWFGGKRLLERPVEQLLASNTPDIPFCLCWANENWTRRWDGQENEVLMAQAHSVEDDIAVICDLIRFFRDERYIKIDGRPLILVYRVTLFPNFAETAARWREVCREQGLGEIYIAMVESFELVNAGNPPSTFGCDSAVEFPPQGLAEQKEPSGKLLNPGFKGSTADYRDLAVRYATRQGPAYTRFKGVMPGWDNTARRQDNSFCFENASPGAFQAWLEEAIDETRQQNFGDEQIVFVNAWNEWAEGTYLEPDRRYGHTYLEAVKNATDASRLLKK